MPWWGWLILAWSVGAGVLAAGLGRATRLADARDWVRRGRPERRAGPRTQPRQDDAPPE